MKEPYETTLVFVKRGDEIQDAINKRATRHQNEIKDCMDSISMKLLKDFDGDTDNLVTQLVSLMLSLVLNKHLTGRALSIKTQLERAAYLTEEKLDLLCIARNLNKQDFYKVTLEEAKRYGLI